MVRDCLLFALLKSIPDFGGKAFRPKVRTFRQALQLLVICSKCTIDSGNGVASGTWGSQTMSRPVLDLLTFSRVAGSCAHMPWWRSWYLNLARPEKGLYLSPTLNKRGKLFYFQRFILLFFQEAQGGVRDSLTPLPSYYPCVVHK